MCSRLGYACRYLTAQLSFAALPSKRGNRYLRTLLVHGARSTLYHARRKTDPRSLWLQRLQAKRGHNVAAVALANKNARIAWALLRFGQAYRPLLAHAPIPERGPTPAASAPGRRAGLTLKLPGVSAAGAQSGIFPSRPSKGEGRAGKMLLRRWLEPNFTPTSCERDLLQRI